MGQQRTDIRSLFSLQKYLSVLAQSYPKPMRASMLAEKTGFTRPAVTKMRERLMQVCDPNTMAFDKGFLLCSSSDVFITLFLVFSASGQHREFLSSNFVRSLFNSRPVHTKINQVFPLYGKYFTEENTKFILSKLLDMSVNINPSDLKQVAKSLLRNPPNFTDFAFIGSLQKIVRGIKFSIRTKEELDRTFAVRDKFFFLTREILWSNIQEMKILGTLKPNDGDAYISVYKHTIDFYLRQIFESLNEPILQGAKSASIKIPRLGPSIGSTALVEVEHESTIRR